MASVRSARVFWILGSRTLPSAPNTTKKPISPMISSVADGMSGFVADASARWCITMQSPALASSVREDERHHDADQRERFGERETHPHVGADHARRLRLAGHRLGGVAEDQADAHAGADGREAVGNGSEPPCDGGAAGGERVGYKIHHLFRSFVIRTGGFGPPVRLVESLVSVPTRASHLCRRRSGS